jgi:WD40 repeat protein
METRAGAHPSSESLQAYALGKLNEAAARSLSDHLVDCPACREQAAAMSADSFLARLRGASAPGAPAPAKSRPPTNTAAGAAEATTIPPVPGLPPELAGHPQYQIVRELGRGGMGVVYLAHNKLMGRREVLKVVNKDLLERPGIAERFLREIQSAARLNHPNVVTAYSALEFGGSLAFAMEYVEGEDLYKAVKARGPLPVANACFYAREAALGLQHAHDKGMVHRDIKPQNLILARQGKKHAVKVLDFGLAKVLRERGGDGSLTGTGMMMGTPDYIAPEQAVDAARADIRADIYSLGCTLYFLLTGAPPFKGSSLYEIIQAHHSAEPKAVNVIRPEVPDALAAVVRKMMAKDPADRYQTPAEVAKELAPFVKPGAGAVPVVEVAPARAAPTTVTHRSAVARATAIAPARKRKPRGMLKWLWLAAVGLGLAVIVAGSLGMVALRLFPLKAAGGILVVEVNEPNPDVFVDGEKVAVTWSDGGTWGEVRVKPGTRKVEVTKDGFAPHGESVEIEDGKRRVVSALLYGPGNPGGAAGAAAYASTGGITFVHFGPGEPRALAFLQDDLRKHYSVRVYDLATGRPVTPPLYHGGRLTHTTFSPDGHRVLTSGHENAARVFDADTGKLLFRLVGHTDFVNRGAFSPDSQRIVTAGEDKTARIWDAETGKPLLPPLRHDDTVSFATFSPDGRRVLTAGPDGTARVWDAGTGAELARLKHGAALSRVACSADGRRVVTAGADGTARVWDTATGAAVGLPLKHGDRVKFLSFSPDGRRVATASADTTARVWDAATGEAVTPPLTHAKDVNGVVFSPDGKRVVTASSDRTARVWDATTGESLSPPLAADGTIYYALFSPDGRRVVAACSDGTTRSWDAETGKEVQQAPAVIATWSMRIRNDPPVTHKLFANGRVDLPHSPNTWEVKGHVLTFRWPDPNAPGGVWVDVCNLSADKKTYSGKNQNGTPLSGVRVRGDNLPDEPPPRP